MTKKLLGLLLAALMLVSLMVGCTTEEVVWYSESGSGDANQSGDGSNDEDSDADADADADADTNDGSDTKKTNTKKTTTKRQKTTTGKKTTQGKGTKTRATRDAASSLTFTPVADSGANYNVSGKVTIAVDTVRSTDYDAMFDVMLKLYPNIDFVFDYWSHNTNDDGREYLTTRMSTGTAANIMWDEAGEIPSYIMNGGWIKPITSYLAKDPEAANIPANLKANYTYHGNVFAAPHQATFEIVAFNTDLVNKLGIKNSEMPGLEWTMDQYEDLLERGAAGYKQEPAICVAIGDLFEAYNRVSWWNATASGGNYGVRGLNYATGQYEVKYLKEGAIQFRAWREIPGVEGWVEQAGTTQNQLKQKFPTVSGYSALWGAGKAFMDDAGTWQAEKWDEQYPELNFKVWTTPNRDGKLMMHVDHCFITSSTPDSSMEACWQALRFMTFSTNGNLARLTMYEDSQKGKYNLNSHVFYPVTTSATVLKKYNDLSCTNEVDEYMVANIKNSLRYDTFKVVPGLRDSDGEWGLAMNNITDGKDPSGAGLDEPAKKVNAKLKEYQTTMKDACAEYYK